MTETLPAAQQDHTVEAKADETPESAPANRKLGNLRMIWTFAVA